MRQQDIYPVIISIMIIILVAVLKGQSRFLAAIAATMPINTPLAIWIVYASSGGEKTVMTEFSQGLVLGLLPSLGFMAAVWWGARAGLKLLPLLGVGYAVWAAGLLILVLFRKQIGL